MERFDDMKCQVCGAESGKYLLCRHCNELKEQGIVIKCAQCRKWHYKDIPCTATVNSVPVIPQDNQYQECAQPTVNPNAVPFEHAGNLNITSDENTYLYAPKQALMTKMERDFYSAILSVLPQGLYVYPQVNLATFIQRTDEAHFQNELYRNVDFLITDAFFAPKIVVEVNDRTHLDKKRQERDQKVRNILEEAGIPMLTLWTSYGVNREYIAGRIQELLNTPVVRKHHFALGNQNTAAPNTSPQVSCSTSRKQGCYIATCVYGSYDCAPVWTLRRFRDETLSSTWYGRTFIRFYYAISPTLVKWFGDKPKVRYIWKMILDKFVKKLNYSGYANDPYCDH